MWWRLIRSIPFVLLIGENYGLNIDSEADCSPSKYLWCLNLPHLNSGKHFMLGHERFLPHPFQFIFRRVFFFSNATTCPLVDFVDLPPGHGRSVTDFWGWDAHEAQLRCPNGVWVVIEEDVVPGGALNLNSTNLPRPWSPRESSPSRKIPTVEPGIEPGTSWLVVRDSDH